LQTTTADFDKVKEQNKILKDKLAEMKKMKQVAEEKC